MVRFLKKTSRKPMPSSEEVVADFYSSLNTKSTPKKSTKPEKSESTPKSTKNKAESTSVKQKKIERSEIQVQPRRSTRSSMLDSSKNESRVDSSKGSGSKIQLDNILGGDSDSEMKLKPQKEEAVSNLAISILEDYSMGSILPEDTKLDSYDEQSNKVTKNKSQNGKEMKRSTQNPPVKTEPMDSDTSRSDDPFGFFKTEREIKKKILVEAPKASSLPRKAPLIRTSTTISQARSKPQPDNILDDLELELDSSPELKPKTSDVYNLRVKDANNSKANKVGLKRTPLNKKASNVLDDISEIPELSLASKTKATVKQALKRGSTKSSALTFKTRKLDGQELKDNEKSLAKQRAKLVDHFKKIDKFQLDEEYV